MNVPIFIICRDRLGCLRQLVAWLERAEGVGDIVMVDNASTYAPLLDWYASQPHRVIHAGGNYGCDALFTLRLIGQYQDCSGGRDRPFYYALTDPDIVPREDCPLDAIPQFIEAINTHSAKRVGFGLELDDVPQTPYGQRVREAEQGFWTKPVSPQWFEALIDSTFAVVRHWDNRLALRGNYPYVARHTPWYLDWDNLPPDEMHYRQTCRAFGGNWYPQ